MTELTSMDDLEQWLAASDQQPIFIFKHSTTCPISASALKAFTAHSEEAGERMPQTCLVKVIESRPISNAIAERLDVTHQSPQVILVRSREALWSASHYGINGEKIAAALDTHT